MYKVAVPINNRTTNEKNRAIFAELFKAARIDRVFLGGHIREDVDSFKENIRFFKDQGYEVALWFYDTVGHGNTIVSAKDLADEPKYQRLVDLDGNSRLDTYCPLDDAHRTFFSEKLAKYAALEPDFIMLDDDFRLSQHGGGVPCCVCPLHMRRLCEECGEELDIPTFKSLAFTGKGNKYRDAWMKVQGESLELFAQAIRDEVDKVNPHVSIAVCSAYCSWDLDGTDPIRITNILAGKNHKYLRLHGAPYWTPLNDKPIEGVCEIGRMFASFCQDEDIEIFSEGDPFRTRFHCPSSYLEIFDAALRADGGHDGILKYMSSYDGMPLYETGFFDRHCRNLDRYDKLAEFFPNGADAGVRVLIKPHLLQDADLSYTPLREQSPYPTAGILLSLNGIPTTYHGEGVCKALFGENARHFDISDFREGAILDGVAAKILTERGLLRGSIHYELNGDTLEVGTDRKYGAIHQFGGVVKIPARTQTVKVGTKGKNKGRFMKAKSKAAHAIERTFTIPAHDVSIPARPFLGLSAEDEQAIQRIIEKRLRDALQNA